MNTIIIITSFVLAVIFFLPTVSIPTTSFSAFTLTKGLEINGITVFKGNMLFVLEVIIPLLMVVICLKMKGKKKAKLSLLFAVAQMIVMILSVELVKRAMANMVEPSITFWFILGALLTLIIIVIDVLIITGKINENADVHQTASGVVSTISATSSAVIKRADKTIPRRVRECPKCGKSLDDDSEFCVFCGTKYAELGKRKCQKCGMILDDDDEFCPSCGTKYVEPKKKICQNCGKELLEDEDFCPFCGIKYIDPDSRICKVCGNKIRPEAGFCGKCGAKYES